MVQVKHFIKTKKIISIKLQGLDIPLFINPQIFPPSPNGCLFAENIKINPNETVIDIGTGSGILGIMAKKLGAKQVYATDIYPEALVVAQKNAILNKVNLNLMYGEYFAGIDKKFDVIVANLPQEIVHPRYSEAIGNLNQSISGGKNGNEHLLNLLKIAPNYMHEKSRLYIPVTTIHFYEQTIKKILENYNAKLIAFSPSQTKEFVSEFNNYYQKLQKYGLINIFKRKGKWMIYEFIFELTKK